MLNIEQLLPTDDELESGSRRSVTEPSDAEKLRYLAKIAKDAGALRPDELAAQLWPLTQWAASNLLIDGEPVQRVIRRLAQTEPSQFKPSRSARIDALRDHWHATHAHLQAQDVSHA